MNILVVTSNFAVEQCPSSNHITDRVNNLINNNINCFVITESIPTISIACEYKIIKLFKNYVLNLSIINKIYYKLNQQFSLNLFKCKDKFANWGLRKYYVRAIYSILNSKNFDLIYSSGGPAVVHLAVYDVIKDNKIPWIAEIQDPLIFNEIQGESYSATPNDLKNLSEAEDVLKYSDALICLTQECMIHYKNKLNKKEVYYIYPGSVFQEKFITYGELSKCASSKIKLIHAGTLAKERNLDALIKSILNLNMQDKIEINLIGNVNSDILKSITKYPNFITYMGILPRDKIIQYLLESDACLVIQNIGSVSRYTIPSKFYEYTALKVPILFLSYQNPEVEHNSNIFNYYYADQSSQEELSNAILNIYKDKYSEMKKSIPIDIKKSTKDFLEISEKVMKL